MCDFPLRVKGLIGLMVVCFKKIDNHALEGIIMEDMHIVMITIVVISAFLLI